MNPEILDLTAPVVFFPVRHHSPACARAVSALIQELRPSAVLIEGPSDYNGHLAELTLPHTLPIAIYSYVAREDGARSSAYYPFCVYSPEWQAIQTAKSLGIPFRFIDLPWVDMAGGEAGDNVTPQRYADGEMRRSDFVAALCRKLGVEDFDSLWDTLFEIDPNLTPREIFERSHHFCYMLREGDSHVPPSDLRREVYMAEQIVQTIFETGSGPFLVVTGGYHSHALFDRLRNSHASEQESEVWPATNISVRGISLTPYSYVRLDSLSGYESGMPSPGFYHLAWDRQAQSLVEPAYRPLLARVVKNMRGRKQTVSTADLIAVETMARGLATLRAHEQVWRTDLIDGIRAALVKDEIEGDAMHPFLAALYEIFRGQERGQLAAGTQLPPLVEDIRQTLEDYDLTPAPTARAISLDLLSDTGRVRSRILHRLRVLEIPGFRRTAGTDFTGRADLSRLWEEWSIQWGPEFDAGCIEAALFGPTLIDAATARLRERVQQADRNSEVAALAMLDAALMGIADVAAELAADAAALIHTEPQFLRAATAMRHLLYLYRYDEALGAARDPRFGVLLTEAYERSLWLLEMLGQVSGLERDIVKGVSTIVEIFERCGGSLGIAREPLIDLLQRISVEPTQAPLLRGAASGALWTLASMPMDHMLSLVSAFSDPNRLGDFLTGLFSLAREVAQRQPELMRAVDTLILTFADEEYMEALPALRLAFSYFTPREKHYLAQTLMESYGQTDTMPLPALEVDAATAARTMALENALYAKLALYGIRGGASS